MSIRPADDHYPTPPEVTRALLSVERFSGGIWEPCAGSGEMAFELPGKVFASTIGEGHFYVQGGYDFLKAPGLIHPNIVTNPPFKIANEIIEHAISLNPAKIALLLNIKFLAGERRHGNLFSNHPPCRFYPFSNRVTMWPAGVKGTGNPGTETFAWFIWEWPFRPVQPVLAGWLNSKDFLEAA